MRKIKNSIQSRQRKEKKLLNTFQDIVTRGSFLSQCLLKDSGTKKYKIAKKRYIDTIEDIITVLEELKIDIEVQEKQMDKVQKYEKIYDEQKEEKQKEEEKGARLGKL